MNETELYKSIVEGMYEGVYFVDQRRKITFWNKGAERITGYSAQEVMGSSCSDNILVHIDECGKELCINSCPLVATMRENCGHKNDQVFLHHKNGQRIPVSVSVSTISDAFGQPAGAVEVFWENPRRDVDEQLLAELKKAALIDQLTGLPNRRYLEMVLKSSLGEFHEHQMHFGLLFADVDHFKQFNDTYGHDLGDKVLQLVSRTLEGNMRPYDMAGRWGGEEFLILIRYVDEEQFRMVGEKLRVLVESSYLQHNGEQLKVTMTMGGSRIRPDDTIEALLKRVDKLLYSGKQTGRNRVVFD
ncbi:sensor domain-containing diguanylate cyclase [Geobacter pelophilus]|jgi:diguanylate cyclase (GGDEF)-like protein/PAS domain S-box-containing protein|uniref:Sensor domain-containing diguanylate cyclase n=1 Tax=Geoanaerobacter pelophilus TaxID=60036 RepID=A0AAW4L6M3_9BACT|nr:sensor domain-containing diguanylate cyclase [Geoanaerobacter pelophilus]MBT0664688.1 sensor domain-containing diguanylate cyclase [Geoanaerobacter pelophilus]